MRTVRELIAAAGGHKKLAAQIGITESGIKRWRQIGIPPKHWALMMRLVQSNIEELEAANAALQTTP